MRRAKGRARSRRCCSTSPNAAVRWASSSSARSKRRPRWSVGSSPTRRSRWSAGWTRPRPGVRSTGSCLRRSASAPPWPSPARCSSRSRRSPCRWPSSSRSRRGPRGCRSRRARRPPPTGRPRATRSRGSAPRPRTTTRPSDRSHERRRVRTGVRTSVRARQRLCGRATPPRMRGLPAAALYHGRAMRFLHTADWHVGKTLKGRSRLAEQEQVLREIVGIARAHEVDAVLVAGDLYDTAAPTADAQKLVNRTLLGLAQDGVEVVAIAGNHDHAATIDAYRGFAKAAGITLVGTIPRVDRGIVEFTARSTGEQVTLAVLPFLSTRYAVRAAEI